jgi:hypothetical protein
MPRRRLSSSTTTSFRSGGGREGRLLLAARLEVAIQQFYLIPTKMINQIQLSRYSALTIQLVRISCLRSSYSLSWELTVDFN